MSFNELLSDYPWLVKRISHLKAKAGDQSYEPPSRHFMAWLLAFFIPRTGVGANAGSILIIIAIIGILAAIAIPQFASYQQRAMEASSINMYQDFND